MKRVAVALWIVAAFCGSGWAHGVVVERVQPGSNAERAGILVGDVLLSYAGKPLETPADLEFWAEASLGQEKIEIRLKCGRSEKKVQVAAGTLGVTVRPALDKKALEFCREAEEALKALTPRDAAQNFAAAADQVKASNLKAWLLLRAAEAVAKIDRDLALDYLRRAWERVESSPAGPTKRATCDQLGSWHEAAQAYPKAAEWYERSLALTEALVPGSSFYADALLRLGHDAKARGDLKKAEHYYLRSLEVRERFDPASLAVASVLTDLGHLARDASDLKEAEDYYRRSLEIRELLAPGSLDHASGLDDLGHVAKARGDLKNADYYYQRRLEILERLAPDSLDAAASLNNLGNVAYARGELEKADEYYQRSLKIIERSVPDSLAVAACLNNLGNVAYARGDLERAEEYHRRSLEIRERWAPNSLGLAGSLNNLGNVAYARGDLERAEEYHRRSLELRERLAPNSLDVGASLNSLGNVAYARGDLERAEEYHRRSLEIRERWAPDSLDAAASLNNLGSVAHDRGDLEGAEEYHRRSLEIRERWAQDSLDVAASLNNLGLVAYGRGDLEKAEQQYRRSLELRERLAPNSLDVATNLNNLGNVAYARGDLERAEEYHRRSLEIHERLAPNSLGVAASLINLGNVVHDRGDLEKAEEYHRRSLEIHERLAPNSLDVARSLNNLGNVAYARGDLGRAEEYHRRSLEIRERLAPNSLDIARSLGNLGTVAHDRGDLEKAIELLEQAVEIAEGYRRSILDPEGRRLFNEQHGSPHLAYTEMLVRSERLAEAYASLERYRSVALRDQLIERGVDWLEQVPELLRAKQRDLINRRSVTLKALERLNEEQSDDAARQGGDLAERKSNMREELRRIDVQQRELDEEMRRASPRYAAIAYPKPPTYGELRRALDPATLHLSYVVTEKETLLFALPGGYGSKDGGLRVFRIEVPADKLNERVENFLTFSVDHLSTHSADLARSIGAQLYEDLIAPAEGMIRNAHRIVISPDGPLHKLPFAALNRNEKEPFQYLIELKPLHIATSLAVYDLLRTDRDRRVETAIPFAGFACPVTEEQQRAMEKRLRPDAPEPDRMALLSGPERALRGANLEKLPDARREVEESARLFGASSEVFLDADASRVKLWEIAPKARVLHLACHGGYYDASPLDSYVRLAPTDQDDGVVWAWRVMREMKLNADLVVLSACETALGRQSTFEGILGLIRALHYAGGRSIVASLWRVDSERTVDLMLAFHEELVSGTTKDVALQRAMLRMLKDPATASPYFWSGFILSGDWK